MEQCADAEVQRPVGKNAHKAKVHPVSSASKAKHSPERAKQRSRIISLMVANENKRRARSSCWVLDPRTSPKVAYWDLIATLALLYVALVTPFEVGFVAPPPPPRWLSGLFLVNRFVDLVFIMDMLLQFRLAYKQENVSGTKWVTDAQTIVKHYASSFWFPLDLFSVLTSLFDILGDESMEDLTALRAVRTLRLIKLVKLARSSRIFKRWEMQMSINYELLSLVSVLIGILLVCHWTACIWGLVGSFEPMNSWTVRSQGPSNERALRQPLPLLACVARLRPHEVTVAVASASAGRERLLRAV